ncbi:MAG: LysR family transcriptional regulator [Pseudomonadota bacterium]
MTFEHLRLFKRICELGSLASASREAGMSTSTASDRLAALEAYYGTALINRTTRAIKLTEAGLTLLNGLENLLNNADALKNTIKDGYETLSGPIRISAPSDLGQTLVCPSIDAFQAKHPSVTFELHLSDGYVDIVGGGFDIALRFGDVTDRALRIIRFEGAPRIVCASPAYIGQFGKPDTPDDLADHRCLLMRFGDLLDNRWILKRGGKAKATHVDGFRMSNDGRVVKRWCLDGVGVALKSRLDIAAELEEGLLVALFEEHGSPPYPLQIVLPPDRHQPARVQAFTEALAQGVRQQIS